MTTDFIIFPDFDPHQFYLELTEETLEGIWQKIPSYSSLSRRWHAYLNQIALTTFSNWLQQEHSITAKVWPNASALPSFWEFVNGTALEFDGVRFLLLPTHQFDISEIEVPQEWVDIPGWIADYYIAMEINPDEGYCRVFGYTTHQELKMKGHYDPRERIYRLSESDLISDLELLWISRQLYPDQPLRETVSPLATLPHTQATQLLTRLGRSSVVVPRLEIPFTLWGALIEHDSWRRRLYQQRIGIPEQWSIRQWLETGVSQVAQELGWSMTQWQPSPVLSKGTSFIAPSTVFSRQLIIAEQPYELRVFLKGQSEETIWRFELWSSLPGSCIPTGMKLRLLSENLCPFENNEDRAIESVDLLFIEVCLGVDEGLIWEIEPTPQNYEPEILRF